MKKLFRKSLSLVATFAMVFTLVTPSFTFAVAQPELKATADKQNVGRGEEFTVTVSLNTNSVENITSLQPKLQYDADVLEPVGDKPTQIMPDISGAIVAMNNDTVNHVSAFSWTNISNSLSYNGGVYKTTFKVKDDAVVGNTALTFDVSDANYPIQNSAENQKVESTIIDTSVNVVIPLNTISLNKTSNTLNVEDSEMLSVTYNPTDTTEDKTVTWTSSNEGVVTCVNGLVTAIGPGSSIVTAKVGTKTATCSYEIKAPLTSISLGGNFEMTKNQTKKLVVTYNPTNTTDDKTVTWEAAPDQDVLTVDNEGNVKALKAGQASVKATVGDLDTMVNITVNEIPLNTISIDQTDVKLVRDGEAKYTVSYNPEDTTDDKTVTWESSDPTVATIDKDGNVKAIKEGTTVIKAKVGEKEATSELVVEEYHLESASLIKSDEDKLAVDNKIPLWVALNPENCTDKLTYKFTSSDSEIATVDEYGNVSGVKEGKVTITATITTEYDKEIVATIDLDVNAKGTGVVTSELNGSVSNSANSPKTGDMPIALIIVLAALTLGASVFIARKKLIKQK